MNDVTLRSQSDNLQATEFAEKLDRDFDQAIALPIIVLQSSLAPFYDRVRATTD